MGSTSTVVPARVIKGAVPLYADDGFASARGLWKLGPLPVYCNGFQIMLNHFD